MSLGKTPIVVVTLWMELQHGNSALESICAGVPMVTWPFLGDQFLNEAFIVEILKIGVRIGLGHRPRNPIDRPEFVRIS
ncbi:UDP-glycosyltransferase 73E1-like protein, partial [Tanacetum coccineum]